MKILIIILYFIRSLFRKRNENEEADISEESRNRQLLNGITKLKK